MTEIDVSNINLDDLFISTQEAHQDVEKYDQKDKIEENKKKEEKQAAKEQKKILQETLKEQKHKPEGQGDEDRVNQLRKKIQEYESNKILGPHLEKCGFKFDRALAKNTPEKLEKQIAKIEKLLSGKTADDGVNTGIKIVMTGLDV